MCADGQIEVQAHKIAGRMQKKSREKILKIGLCTIRQILHIFWKKRKIRTFPPISLGIGLDSGEI